MRLVRTGLCHRKRRSVSRRKSANRPREAGSATTKARWGRLAERSLRSAARRAMIRRARQNRAAPVGMTAMRRTGGKEKADPSTAGAAPFDSAQDRRDDKRGRSAAGGRWGDDPIERGEGRLSHDPSTALGMTSEGKARLAGGGMTAMRRGEPKNPHVRPTLRFFSGQAYGARNFVLALRPGPLAGPGYPLVLYDPQSPQRNQSARHSHSQRRPILQEKRQQFPEPRKYDQ